MSDQTNEKPITLSELNAAIGTALINFFTKMIEPEFRSIRQDISRLESKVDNLESTMNSRFDDLYKKFEDLRQEYIVANAQMKRLEKSSELTRKDLSEFKTRLDDLYQRFEELEKQVQ